MESTRSRLFLMRIQTFEPNISNAWSLLVDTLMLVEIGYVKRSRPFLERISWEKCITITTLPGKKGILIKICGSSEKVQRLIIQVKKALLEEVWEICRLSSNESNPLNLQLLSSRLFAELDVYWEEIRLEENETEKQEKCSQKESSKEKSTMPGLRKRVWSSEVETLMSLTLRLQANREGTGISQ